MITIISACEKKTAGPGGQNTIIGTVYYKNGATQNTDVAPKATVSVSYGTNEPNMSFDQTVLTNTDGTYKIEGLTPGKYFIKANYTDEHGFNYNSPGVGVTFNNKDRKAEANIVLE